ncbi:MAG TPA: DUF4129 domain-containing protein [Frankiaceae bacterium]|nr:DUF4129 domain-containing protein [Frankiaceae bacterium]
MTRLRALVLLALGCALAVAAASTGPFLEPDRETAFAVRGVRVRAREERPKPPFAVEPPRAIRAVVDWFNVVVQVLAILLTAAVILVGLYLFVRTLLALVRLRLHRGRATRSREYDSGETSHDDAESKLRRRVADDLRLLSADLDDDADPREAVIACYVRMERALAEAGSPRGATETPLELLRRVLASFAVPEADVRRLTDLFTEARFSSHPVTDEMRHAARRSLGAVSDALTAGAAP